MADTLTVEVGATAVVPVAYTSQFGVSVPAAAGATVSSEAPPVAAAAISADGSAVGVAGVSVGETQVTLAMNGAVDTMHVSVVAPVARQARLVPAAATFKPTGA